MNDECLEYLPENREKKQNTIVCVGVIFLIFYKTVAKLVERLGSTKLAPVIPQTE